MIKLSINLDKASAKWKRAFPLMQGKIEQAAQHVPAAALERASVTMRPPQVKPVPARAMPGPAALGARGQPGLVVGSQGEHAGGTGRLPAPPNAAALPPHPGTATGGHQPGQPTNTAALPTPGHPGEAPIGRSTFPGKSRRKRKRPV